MQKENYTISTDKNQLDLPMIHQFLTNSYWAKGRTLQQVQDSIDNSLCFGLYEKNQQIDFARVITDFTTFAYLTDVFVIPERQGKGLGKYLVKSILEMPNLQPTVAWLLLTSDAQTPYQKFGFQPFPYPERVMFKKLDSIPKNS